jgi:hypothetical protein
MECGSAWSLAIPRRGSKLPQHKRKQAKYAIS